MAALPPSGPPPSAPLPPTRATPAPAQSRLTRGQRLALWIVGVAALVAALVAVRPPALVAILPTASPTAKPTPNPALLTFRATQTAEASQLTQIYAPQGIGPCDTVDPPFSHDNQNYWQWDTNPGDINCAPDSVTQMIKGDAFMSFYGFPNGFPKAFTATLTLQFNVINPPPGGANCLTYSLFFDYEVQGLMLCDNGMWQSTQYNGFNGYTPPAPGAPFVLTMQVSPTEVAFTVNNAQATPPLYHSPVSYITLRAALGYPTGSSISILSFVLTPLT